jgi:hypothetical protein
MSLIWEIGFLWEACEDPGESLDDQKKCLVEMSQGSRSNILCELKRHLLGLGLSRQDPPSGYLHPVKGHVKASPGAPCPGR